MERGVDEVTHIDKGTMKRVLRVGDLFAVGYGDLGSSIYYALGITALYSLGATPISLAIAGLVFACTALTYAELSSMSKESGGSATYSRMAFNDLISFIAGWGLLLDFIVTIAISAFSVSSYLRYFVPFFENVDYRIGFTILLIATLFLVNLKGTKHSTRLSWVLTTLTLITQIVIILICAFYFIRSWDFIRHMAIGVKGSLWSPTWAHFWKGTAMAMVAYTGIESMAQLTSEAKDPARTVPRAIILAMSMLLFVFVGTAVVTLASMTPQVLVEKYLDNPVAGVVENLPFGGKILGAWVGIFAAIILTVAANAGLIGSSRLSFTMGENYQIPRFFYKLHPRFKTPFVSLGVFALFSSIIVFWSGGKISFLADLYNFGAMLAFFAAHVSLIMLRIKLPDQKRPFKIPFNLRIKKRDIPFSAVFGAFVTFAVWILVIITKPDGRYLGIAWIAIGMVMYFAYRKKHRLRPTGKVEISKVQMPDFKPSSYSKILVPTRGGIKTDTVQMACEIARMHKAEVTAVTVVEVPFSLPLIAPAYKRPASVETLLKETEAVGREFHVGMELKIIHARSVEQAVLEMIVEGEYDLLVLGATINRGGSAQSVSPKTDSIIRHCPCPVWVCFSSLS